MPVALRQLERTEARQRIIIGILEATVFADMARLLKGLQETSVVGGYRRPAEARASYVRVLSPPAPDEPVFWAAA